jgi:chromosome segregation protein
MRLRRLELQGFKSFLDRTILSFDPGVTGVVGPNGCGKSNIVDAILWVMGEQSPKHLRGESMTDVIFNGSDSRAPTSMAEVSLVLDREGVALAPQFSAFSQGEEITITRRIYRDGAGEYLINKSICRLRDIHELFMDTGVGRRAYSIIEQGQIDRMINVKPEDRRYLFEEVAGITKYKTKRKEAEKKLEATNLNLARLQDIIVELEKQIRSLKIQATKARKYREIKQELEVADLFVLGRSLFNKKNLLEELDKEKNERVNEKSELDAKVSQVDAEVTELDIRRIDEEKQYQNLSQRERELAVSLQKLEGQLEVLAERQKFLLQNKENLETELNSLTIQLEETQTEKDQLKSASEELENELQQKLNEVKDQESTFAALQSEKHRKTESKNALEVELSSLNEKEIQCRSLTEHLSSKSVEMTEQLETLSQERAELTTAELQTKSSVQEIEQKIEACLLKSKEAEAISAEVHADCQKLSSELSLKEEELFRTREEHQGKRSRLESLKELQENLEGYSPTAREILLKLTENALTAAPLADCFQPDPELEDCLELLLGNEMNTLVVSSQEEAENLVRVIEEKQLERVRVVASGSVGQVAEPSFPGLIPVTQKLKVKPGYENLVRHWLGSVFICETEAQVFELAKQHTKHTFICLSSRVVAHGDTSFSCGIPQVTVGVFARKREIEELHSACEELSAKVATLTDLRASLLSELETQEAKGESLKSELSKIHVEHVELRKEKERFLGDLNRLQKATISQVLLVTSSSFTPRFRPLRSMKCLCRSCVYCGLRS